ncbi:MAG: CpaF family protein, partial [bacterium]
TISREAADFLAMLVRSGYSILIGGGTSAGKTTFLNALSACIPKEERIITVEDNAELRLQGLENLVRLEAKTSNLEGASEITIRDLVRASLRMRPDRIVVGEVRGGEAVDLLQALNTGHDGSLSTIHANSAEDMISRLEMMVLMAFPLPLPAIRRQIASGVQVMVYLKKDRQGKRRVAEIVETDGMSGENVRLRTLYAWNEKIGDLQKTGELLHTEKLL